MALPEKNRWFWPSMLLFVFLIFFHRVIFLGDVFFFRDHYQEYYPLKNLALEMLKAGHLPVWNPSSMMGQPLLANPNWTLLYPPNIFLALGDFAHAYSLLFAAHFLIAMLGFYYLCRVTGRSRPASCAGSLVYSCGGYFLAQGSFMPFLFTMCWQPIVLAEILRNWNEHNPRRRWALIGAASLLILGGEPVTILNTAALALILLLPEMRNLQHATAHLKTITRDPRWLSLILLLIAIFPRALFLINSGRFGGLSLDMAADFSLHPRMLINFIVPNIFGDIHQYFPWRVFGAYLTGHRFPYLLSVYIGIPCLLLAGARLSQRPLPFLPLILSAISFLLALGRATPLFEIYWNYFPFASMIRFPIKFVFFPIFFAALWASEGFDILRQSRFTLLSSGIVAIFAILFLGMAWFTYSPFNVVRILPEAGSIASSVSLAIRREIITSAVFIMASVLSLILLIRHRSWPIIAIIILDVLHANYSLNPTTSSNFYSRQPLAERFAHSNGRVMVLAPFRGIAAEQPPPYHSYSEYLNAGGRAELYALSSIDSGIKCAFDPSIDRSFSSSLQVLIDGLAGKTFAETKPIFDLVGIRWFLSPEPITAPGLILCEIIQTPPLSQLYLYENSDWINRFSISTVQQPRICTPKNQIRLLFSGFLPSVDLLIDRQPRLDHSRKSTFGDVTIISETPTKIVLRTHCDAPSFLICTDTYHPDWHACLDGTTVPIFQANGVFRVIEAPAGDHTVELLCRMWPHYMSLEALALLSILVVCGLLGRHGLPVGYFSSAGR